MFKNTMGYSKEEIEAIRALREKVAQIVAKHSTPTQLKLDLSGYENSKIFHVEMTETSPNTGFTRKS